ncbi:hypothetical protein AUC69_07065 [Methyloceanibacter superfactus]|jgi:hypothetical protein|uniref:Uncharacterized protein n=1 Tax=Methyloceanibacter superfactus TaxID=1774969 RepID=A0A1E3W7D1_9HYPH|nr:hypothetical protein [Methyloceanibacter superfactus]ODS01422.1 hypothetical protein AUC69_07065 [Methyloceanibacter superfactus]
MFRLLLMVGGSSLVLGLATASYALTAPPQTLNGFAAVAIPVADDMEEEAVEQALEPEEVTPAPAEDSMESEAPAPSEETEIDAEEGKQ